MKSAKNKQSVRTLKHTDVEMCRAYINEFSKLTQKTQSKVRTGNLWLVKEHGSRCGHDVLIGRTLVQLKGFLFLQDQETVEIGCSLWATASITERLQAERGVMVALNAHMRTHTHTLTELSFWIYPRSCLQPSHFTIPNYCHPILICHPLLNRAETLRLHQNSPVMNTEALQYN